MSSRHFIAFLLAVALSLAAIDRSHADEDGFKSLFNGKDLSGWKGDSRFWSVEEGALTGRTTAENLAPYNTFLVREGEQPGDFELRFKYRIVGGNSGVQYRSQVTDKEKYIVKGYQADIDSSPRFTGMNYEEGGRGFLAQRGERVELGADGKKKIETIGDKDELQKGVKKEDWNELTVVAKGNRLTHSINGTLMSEVIDNQSDKAATKGGIAIQIHKGPPMLIQIKEMRIKALK